MSICKAIGVGHLQGGGSIEKFGGEPKKAIERERKDKRGMNEALAVRA